ncbi:CCA tRNA nucleotidyltransferase [Paenibacillus physcomitrellae]|nr:CCA tRNA nucleotidyltransferase [Paenibacillus physcomitrellae]
MLWLQAEPGMAAAGDEVLVRLEAAGHQAFYVGGCVRDELMGRPVHDMDIATSAQPEQVMELFERTVPTGLAHGTVTVLLGEWSFEVTTFRRETGYTDHRRPEEVEFVDAVDEDLKRRDFTMNAIARSLDGQLFDPYGGRGDIGRGWIRCVGKPEERFEEDALRMLRAVRFASVFGFKPLPSLWRGLLQCRDGMAYIAVERIRSELERIVLGPRPMRGLELLRRSGLLLPSKAPLPAAAKLSQPEPDVLAVLAMLSALPADEPSQRWSLLLQALRVSAEEAEPLLRGWTFPGVLTRQISALLHIEEAVAELLAAGANAGEISFAADVELESANRAVGTEKLSGSQEKDGCQVPNDRLLEHWRRYWVYLQLTFGKEAAALWLQREAGLQSANPSREDAKGTDRNVFLAHALKWHSSIPVHKVADLALTAGDVMSSSGRRGGPWLGELMKDLLERVAAGDLNNDKAVLLDAVKERLNDGT